MQIFPIGTREKQPMKCCIGGFQGMVTASLRRKVGGTLLGERWESGSGWTLGQREMGRGFL